MTALGVRASRALVIVLLALAACWATASAAGAAGDRPAVVRAVAFGQAGPGARLVVEVDEETAFNVFALDGPPRIVLDMANVAFELGAAAPDAGIDLVAAWRFGEIAPGRARIVLDLAGPALPARAFYLPPLSGAPGRIVVELQPAEQAAFAAAVTRAAPPQREARTAIEPPRARGAGRPVLVIDPGHGGIDPGAVGISGVLEKDLALAFSQTLRDILEARGAVDVHLTREDDRFLSLGRRVEIAREQGAHLFLSIHADAAPQAYVRGATVYTLSERASDAQAAFIAERENRADEIAGLPVEEARDEVVDILADLTRRETRAFSRHFADVLVRALGESVNLIRNPHRSARFRVLKAYDVPSVLVEIGYLSNEEDERLMTQAGWRLIAATAIAAAVETFFEETRVAGAPAADAPR